ncbi:MAG: hypothetical protein H9W81_08055 [Enterococcus sp.]|nr:hypothetical protein [Enterococcus sp.]
MGKIGTAGTIILEPSDFWDRISLGVTADGEKVIWDVKKSGSAMLLSSSLKGRGGHYSEIQRDVILHCFQHLNRWRVVGLDPKKMELTPYNHYHRSQMWVGSGVENSVELLRDTFRQMQERYLTMEAYGVNNFRGLNDQVRAVMVIVDEASLLMSEANPAKDETVSIMLSIIRFGRAAGFHILLSTSNPEVLGENETLVKDTPCKIFAGRQTEEISQLLLGNDDAFNVEGEESYIHELNRGTAFQNYYAPERWFEDFLLNHYLETKK